MLCTLGTPDISLRSKSDFSLEDVIEGVRFAHDHRVRVYLTLNLFAHNEDVEKLDTFIDTIRRVQPDRLIIAAPGVFQYLHERAPEIPLDVVHAGQTHLLRIPLSLFEQEDRRQIDLDSTVTRLQSGSRD